MLAPPLLLGSNQSMSGNKLAREKIYSAVYENRYLSEMIHPWAWHR